MKNDIEQIYQNSIKEFDQVLIRQINYENIGVSFEDCKFKKVESSINETISLSVTKDKYFGFAYTTSLGDIDIFIQNAKNSLTGKVDGSFEFAEKDTVVNLDTYKKTVEKITSEDILIRLNQIIDYLKNKTKAQINLEGYLDKISLRILTNKGVDYNQKISTYVSYISLIYPGSYSNVSRILASYDIEDLNKDTLDFLLQLYNQSENQVRPKSGKMKVLFLPEAFYTFIFRLSSALSGNSLIYKRTPLEGKIDQKICSEKFTLFHEPHRLDFPYARAFDDEGTKTKKINFIENGILNNFYFDRKSAYKYGTKPTAHGYCQEQNEPASSFVPNFIVEKGDKTIYQLISMIDKGVIIPSVLGAHSGNIQNGDFSIGLSPGIYVENGNIVGHVKDAMVAANIYDCLNKIIAIEDKIHFSIMGSFPAILFDDINVTIK
ncbi:MAG: TldD/PmbA family protein [Exilispira sp.]|nr:TldD/PmbA family protein [Exilispira sp.]